MSEAMRQRIPDVRRSRITLVILKGLFLYVFLPALCLILLAPSIGGAARASDSAVFLVLLAALGCVCVNWAVYAAVNRKHPSLPVFAWGVCCLLAVLIIEYEALPHGSGVLSTLANIGGCLILVLLYLLCFWFASRRSKFAHVTAVGMAVTIGIIACLMAYSVARDIESRIADRDTWIYIVILAAVIPAAFSRKIHAAARRSRRRRTAVGLTDGRIMQLIGETRFDRYDDLVTDYHARVQYTVDGVQYETKTGINKVTMRRFGKKAFVGRDIPVHYHPDSPGDAFTDRLDRRFAKAYKPDPSESGEEETPPEIPENL